MAHQGTSEQGMMPRGCVFRPVLTQASVCTRTLITAQIQVAGGKTVTKKKKGL